MIPMTRFKAAAAASLAVFLLLSAGVSAQTVDIPYQGWLTQGELPCGGEHEMVFTLCDEIDAPVQSFVFNTSDLGMVDVVNGAFSVVLPVDEAVVIANQVLYLGIEVEGEELVNRQRIYPAMYAARGEMGVDEFWVKDASSEAGLAITSGLRGHTETRTDVSEISNDTGAERALVIAGNKSAGGSRRVKIYDELAVNGPVTVEGRTFRGLRWKLDSNGEIEQWQVTGTAQMGIPFDGAVDMGVAPSDGMCILISHNEAVTTISSASDDFMPIVRTRCQIFRGGTPETWHLRGRSECDTDGIGCWSIGIYCQASCVLWNWPDP